jgi:hypothetical protein
LHTDPIFMTPFSASQRVGDGGGQVELPDMQAFLKRAWNAGT